MPRGSGMEKQIYLNEVLFSPPPTASDNILLNSEEKLRAVIESHKCWDGKQDVSRCGVMRYRLEAIVVVKKRLALYKFIQYYTFMI